VSADELGRTVHDRRGAEFQRLLQDRGGQRVVHDRRDAARVRCSEDAPQVDDAEQRVDRRLDPEHVRLLDPGQDRIGVGQVNGQRRQPALRGQLGQQTAGTGVRVGRQHDH
jgi:hypothetical protein